jgi:tellurite resistance protein TerC
LALKRALHLTYRAARRVVIAVVGLTVVLIGVILIFTPGPAMVVIPAGLAILSIEFAWARRWLRRLKDTGRAAVDRVRGRNGKGE